MDGRRHVSYKEDGNSLGYSGSYLNSVPPLISTPINLREVKPDGVIPVRNSAEILGRGDRNGPLVEAPDIIRTIETVYVPFHSTHCFTSLQHDMRYTAAANLTGLYVKNPTTLLETGDYRLQGPGGAKVTKDGQKIVVHLNHPTGRNLYKRAVQISGTTVRT